MSVDLWQSRKISNEEHGEAHCVYVTRIYGNKYSLKYSLCSGTIKFIIMTFIV